MYGNPQAKGLLKEEENLSWKLQPGMVIRFRVWEDNMRDFLTKDGKPSSNILSVTGADDLQVNYQPMSVGSEFIF